MWSVSQNGNILEIVYGSGIKYPPPDVSFDNYRYYLERIAATCRGYADEPHLLMRTVTSCVNSGSAIVAPPAASKATDGE